MWYPSEFLELEKTVEGFLNQKPEIDLTKIPEKINGLIVPHAGYEYSGAIAGKAYSILKNRKISKAIIIGPSHYFFINEPVTYDKELWGTPLGNIKTFNLGFKFADIKKEHSIDNQIPFLQELGVKKIMPLMIGEIDEKRAKEIAEKISNSADLFIFSSDLSHFLPYSDAEKIDKKTIEIIESLDIHRFSRVDACGAFPILILFHLCKILKTHPHLIEYKNSGDVTGDKKQVVGYGSFWF